LDLIDHMDKLIDEENDRGRAQVNFQKASCTLDASIKIYSYRVDDTWSASYRILENLNRTDNEQPKQAKVGTKTTSSKVCGPDWVVSRKPRMNDCTFTHHHYALPALPREHAREESGEPQHEQARDGVRH
jgi:hypothetical protein